MNDNIPEYIKALKIQIEDLEDMAHKEMFHIKYPAPVVFVFYFSLLLILASSIMIGISLR